MARTTFGLALLAALVAAGGGSPGAEEIPSVTYRLIDLAGVPPGILEAGAASAESAFRRVGLRLQREELPDGMILEPKRGCAPPLHVFVLGERSFRAANPHPDTLGYTTATTAGAPPAAMISFHRVERTAARYGVAPVVVFGHVMAHELGHLLLGRRSHGRSTLMKETLGLLRTGATRTGEAGIQSGRGAPAPRPHRPARGHNRRCDGESSTCSGTR